MPTIVRDDISDQLIHFTKPRAGATSLQMFTAILTERNLIAGTGMIKGQYKCVCFTEAPIGKLPQIFAAHDKTLVRYAPYGFMFSKTWLYGKGARPVIYGP